MRPESGRKKPPVSNDDSPSSDAADEDDNSVDYDDGEDDEEEENERVDESDFLVQWTGPSKRTPVVLFRADAILEKDSSAKAVGEKYKLAFKIVKTECKIVRSIMQAHGFHEVHPNSLDFNLMWTGSHIKPYVLRGFSEFQKINHFPRSYEITRKDRLSKNVQRMQHLKGFKHFDIIPQTFITPLEFGDFQTCFLKEKGCWIVKPVASSRGRGIFLVTHPSQVPMDETLIVSRYIMNPLLIDDFKFDVRLYVVVTSYDPLIVYLYEEGLARFASQKFERSSKSVRNQFMHLTNYSVNKRNPDFVKCSDPDLEDYGNKWSMSAMLRYLKSTGKDTATLMMRIEDVVIKTFLAGEMAIASATNMFMPQRGNCFELYGFDILIDDNLKPWLVEVNLSPSLACDAPIDLKIKANMMSDLFSLVGLVAQDPVYRRIQLSKRNQDFLNKNTLRQQRQRPTTAGSVRGQPQGGRKPPGKPGGRGVPGESQLTQEEARIVRMAREEYARRGRFIRIFPSETSWETYGSLMEHRTTHNSMLFNKLFPNRTRTTINSRPSSAYPSLNSRNRGGGGGSSGYGSRQGSETGGGGGGVNRDQFSCEIIGRLLQYERKLLTLAETRAAAAAVNGHPASGDQAANQDGEPTVNGRRASVEGSHSPTKNGARLAQGVEMQLVEQVGDTKTPRDGLPPPDEVANDDSRSVASDDSVDSDDERVDLKARLMALLEDGQLLSVTQARSAFAAYLLRVHKRLLRETTAAVENTQDDEQMDLVLRFLKRAAQNLSQVFRVVVPSKRLPIHDRRRILAKQLYDFVHIYSRDTQTIGARLKSPSHHNPDKTYIAEKLFNEFLQISSEGDLEEVLTTFTKINKSASIFLGGVNSSYDSSAGVTSHHVDEDDQSSSSQPKRSTSQTRNSRRPPRDVSSDRSAAVGSRPASSKMLQRDKSVERRDRSVEREIRLNDSTPNQRRPPSSHHVKDAFGEPSSSESADRSSPPSNPVATTSGPATQAAAARLKHTLANTGGAPFTPPQTEISSGEGQSPKASASRPVSAKSTNGQAPQMSQRKKNRPYSAIESTARIYSENLTKTMMPQPSASGMAASLSKGQTVHAKSEEAIAHALQRLAKRQATRQYSAANNNLINHLQSINGSGQTTKVPNGSGADASSERTADMPSWEPEAQATAYSLVTGVNPTSAYQATPGSSQFRYLQTSSANNSTEKPPSSQLISVQHRPSTAASASSIVVKKPPPAAATAASVASSQQPVRFSRVSQYQNQALEDSTGSSPYSRSIRATSATRRATVTTR